MSNTIIIHEPHSEITPVLSRHERFRFWLQGKHPALRFGYKIIIGIAGFSTILVGIALLVFPGPGWLLIFAGLALLSLEFTFAQRLNKWVKQKFVNIWHKIRKQK
jgi:uncharacterized protein (TIGR02611 family)